MKLFIFLAGVSALAWAKGPVADLDTTARTLYLRDHLRADFTAEETTKGIAQVKTELAVLLQKVTDDAQAKFYLPELFQRGTFNLTFKPDVDAALAAQVNQGAIDATKPLGNATLDALNRAWGVTRYQRPWENAKSWQVTFASDKNPYQASDAFQASGLTKWAEPSLMVGLGGTEVVHLAPPAMTRNRQPSVWALTIGWGDCMSGCMAVHRVYYEVRQTHRNLPPNVFKIGDGGTPLTPDLAAIFKPE